MLKKPYSALILPLLVFSVLIRMAFYGQQLIELNAEFSPFTPNQNIAVFAAFSADGTVSDYVLDYLKKLKQISPNIIYVTDNPIKRVDAKKITPYVNHIIASRHGEYDWGSYKRGLTKIPQNQKFNKLILCNDSTLPLASSFAPIIDKMTADNADFYGITANQDGTYHLQSYFLVFNPNVWQTADFWQYFAGVKAEKDGLTVAYRYEVPFTQYLENLGYKSATYIPYGSLSALPLNDKNCYPLTLVSQYNAPFLKMRTFTDRLNVQESRKLLFHWLKENRPEAYENLIKHLKKINSPYLKDNK